MPSPELHEYHHFMVRSLVVLTDGKEIFDTESRTTDTYGPWEPTIEISKDGQVTWDLAKG